MGINRKVMGDLTYQEYLNSHWWLEKRDWIIHCKEDRCEKCRKSKFETNLQVHHLNYDSLGNENIHDVQVLCGYCHRKVHGIKKKDG